MLTSNNEQGKEMQLTESEVNVYGIVPCGQAREDCLTDCVGGGAFLSTVD